jgi:hypothetical protein
VRRVYLQGMATSKLRPIRTTRRDGSVSRSAVASAVKAVVKTRAEGLRAARKVLKDERQSAPIRKRKGNA